MITVEKITKRFGNKTALNQIQFNVDKGEIFGFLGPSGAGKTTLINILTGQLKADEGTTQLLGKDTKDLTPEDLARRRFKWLLRKTKSREEFNRLCENLRITK